MTQEQVIKLGKKALEVDGGILLTLSIIALVAGVLIFFFALMIEIEWAISLGFILGVIGLISTVCIGVNLETKTDEQVAKWREETAAPYIESLPVEKREVVYIKIDPELSEKISGGYHYTTSKTIERTALSISFKENGLTTLTNFYEANMDLTDEEKPYVTYQYVPKKLGKGVGKGFYNVKVHLPENYKFTDIK